ncbi:MAG: hypothetical protein R3Y13_01515 [bacterium]
MKKNIKKTLLSILLLICIVGCTSIQTASSVVEDYLSSYQNLEYQILVDMETVINSEDLLTDDQKQIYREILKKQYSDLYYEVIYERYNNDEAIVGVNITVYNYYETQKESGEYLSSNPNEFNNEDGKYDVSLYMDYKLSMYQSDINRITNYCEFLLIKEDGIWKIKEINNDVLEKIHGIYNYEQ